MKFRFLNSETVIFLTCAYALIVMQSCSAYNKIAQYNIKFTDSTVVANIELLLDSNAVDFDKKAGVKNYKSYDSAFFKELQKRCLKNDVGFEYQVISDTSDVIIKLLFKDPTKIRGFLNDMQLYERNEMDPAFPLRINYNETEDSIFYEMKFERVIFPKRGYISVESPTTKTYFSPTETVDSLLVERISPNKMFYTIEINNDIHYLIKCHFKKNKKRQDVFLESSDGLKLFGYSKDTWQFWCTIIGGIASIVTIYEVFRKKK